jgi:HEAT repeat protein
MESHKMTEQGSTVSLVVETEPDLPTFLDDKIDLKKLAREIVKASSAAVDVLVKLLESTDERVRLQAATKLVEFQVQVAKEISADQMQRLIAEIKLVRAPQQKLVDANNPSKPNRPMVDFSTIREVK